MEIHSWKTPPEKNASSPVTSRDPSLATAAGRLAPPPSALSLPPPPPSFLRVRDAPAAAGRGLVRSSSRTPPSRLISPAAVGESRRARLGRCQRRRISSTRVRGGSLAGRRLSGGGAHWATAGRLRRWLVS